MLEFILKYFMKDLFIYSCIDIYIILINPQNTETLWTFIWPLLFLFKANTILYPLTLNLTFTQTFLHFYILIILFNPHTFIMHIYCIGNCVHIDKKTKKQKKDRQKERKYYTVKLYPPEKPNHISWWWHDRNHMLLCPSSHYIMIHHFQTAAIKRRAGALRPDKSNITQNKVINSWPECHWHIGYSYKTAWHVYIYF